MDPRLKKARGERTLVLVKPDAVMRGLIGRILQRFEDAGLTVVGMKLVQATRKQLDRHSPHSRAWVRGLAARALETYTELRQDPGRDFGTHDADKIGAAIRETLYGYLTCGPVVAIVLQGADAIEVVRKLVGNAIPRKANPGTIRGDFSTHSPTIANIVQGPVVNVVHASSNADEARQEINCWFHPDELVEWERSDSPLFLMGIKSPIPIPPPPPPRRPP